MFSTQLGPELSVTPALTPQDQQIEHDKTTPQSLIEPVEPNPSGSDDETVSQPTADLATLPKWIQGVLPLLRNDNANQVDDWKALVNIWIHMEAEQGFTKTVNGPVSIDIVALTGANSLRNCQLNTIQLRWESGSRMLASPSRSQPFLTLMSFQAVSGHGGPRLIHCGELVMQKAG